MGLKFKDIIVKNEIEIKDLKDKVLAVDSMNLLYQFLTTIRAADGSNLTNSKGDVTSHLIGLFNQPFFRGGRHSRGLLIQSVIGAERTLWGDIGPHRFI